MQQDKIEQLLGRPLSTKERAGFEVYLEIAQTQLEGLLGYSLSLSAAAAEDKTYRGNSGYRSVFTSPFTNIVSVKVNGKAVSYYVGESSKPIKHEIVLESEACDGDVVVVNAKWGFSGELPKAVQLLVANLLAVVANGQAIGSEAVVKSETVLSHSVSFDNSKTQIQSFIDNNTTLIDMYRIPKVGDLQAGNILWGSDDDLSGYSPYY